jgi:hypothetical protein
MKKKNTKNQVKRKKKMLQIHTQKWRVLFKAQVLGDGVVGRSAPSSPASVQELKGIING